MFSGVANIIDKRSPVWKGLTPWVIRETFEKMTAYLIVVCLLIDRNVSITSSRRSSIPTSYQLLPPYEVRLCAVPLCNQSPETHDTVQSFSAPSLSVWQFTNHPILQQYHDRPCMLRCFYATIVSTLSLVHSVYKCLLDDQFNRCV